MTKKEAALIIAIMQTNYPDSFSGKSDTMVQGTVSLWAEMFADEPFEQVSAAVKAYIATDENKWMPNVGQIKKAMYAQRGELTEGEAWQLVNKALKNGYYGAAQEFTKLPPLVQKAVGAPSQLRDWSLMDTDTVQSVVASNFMRCYRIMQARDDEDRRLPAHIKDVLALMGDSMKMDKAVKKQLPERNDK